MKLLFSLKIFFISTQKANTIVVMAHQSMETTKPINLGLCQSLSTVLIKLTTICIETATEALYAQFPEQNFCQTRTQPSSSFKVGMSSNLVIPVFPQSPIPRITRKDNRFQRVSLRKQTPKKKSLRFSMPFSDPHPQPCPLVSHTTARNG